MRSGISLLPTIITMFFALVTAVYNKLRDNSMGAQENIGSMTTGYSLP